MSAQRATVLALSDPLLDALGVEYVFFVTVEGGNKVVAHEVTPADGTLAPQTAHRFVQILILLLEGCLLVLELRLVE